MAPRPACGRPRTLTDTGSVFVQIGDENVHLVRCVLDEIFGGENMCAHILFKKTGASTDELLPSGQDHLLWFAKDRERVKYRQLYRQRALGSDGTEEYMFVELADSSTRDATPGELAGISPLPAGGRAFRYTTRDVEPSLRARDATVCIPRPHVFARQPILVDASRGNEEMRMGRPVRRAKK